MPVAGAACVVDDRDGVARACELNADRVGGIASQRDRLAGLRDRCQLRAAIGGQAQVRGRDCVAVEVELVADGVRVAVGDEDQAARLLAEILRIPARAQRRHLIARSHAVYFQTAGFIRAIEQRIPHR